MKDNIVGRIGPLWQYLTGDFVRPTWITIHSEQGKDRPDAYDFGDLDERMAKDGIHYDRLCENVTVLRAGKQVIKPVLYCQWPVTEVGAHCRGFNGTPRQARRSIGFAFAGDARKEPPTDDQLMLMARFVRSAMLQWDIPLDRVRLHRDMPDNNTDCPGKLFPVERWKELLR